MAVNKVVVNTENGAQTLIDLTGDTITADKLAKGVTAHDKSGKSIVGTMSSNTKTYEITLAKLSEWILLTTLDADVLEHINDASLVVSLANVSGYAYEWFAGSMYICSNTPWGYNGSYPAYGISNIESSETTCQVSFIYYPANYTGTATGIGGRGTFRINGNKYYFKPADGFIRAGTYRLTFTW